MEENIEAAEVYMMARGQVITRMHVTQHPNGAVRYRTESTDIKLTAVRDVMDVREVTNQKRCMEKVMNVFHHFLAERRSDD